MAVYSMTGYASTATALASGTLGEIQLSVEIRSVNSRFLDISFRLPDELRQNEPALRALITSNIKRGKVEIRAALENSLQNLPAKPSAAILEQLQTIEKDIQTTLKDARSLSVADVLRLSGTTANTFKNNAETAQSVLSLTQAVVQDLLASREREGARLTLMLQSHLGQLRVLAAQAGPLIPMLVAQQRSKFMDRWKEALSLGGAETTEIRVEAHQMAMDRALNEATAFAIRIDVAEELTRLASHLDEIEQILQKGGEMGKKLDFLIQELHREANTLGSKSSVLELTRISVEMKVLIEQMREQVQNIE
ncbi:MAG: YicC/YloC family endoribonuclease [Burkholderiaceae bacterium]